MLEVKGKREVGYLFIHEIKSSLESDIEMYYFALIFLFSSDFIFLSFCFVSHLRFVVCKYVYY